MYKVSRILLSILLISLISLACEGPSGSEGPQGVEGPVGPAGEDGSMMYSGEGEPDNTIGDSNDYYLNESTGELYGPKNENGWGPPISLQGPPGEDGVDGQDGSQIFNGSGAPDVGLGSEGDYYLNEDDFELYGPKTENGWGTPISLKGTANVLYSSWIDINWNVMDNNTQKTMSIAEERITNEFIDAGVVKMYLLEEDSNNDGDIRLISSLPFVTNNTVLRHIVVSQTDSYTQNIPADFKGILIDFESMDGSNLRDITSLQVRYVLIPGGEQLKSKTAGGEIPIDLDDYEQVKKYFGLQN